MGPISRSAFIVKNFGGLLGIFLTPKRRQGFKTWYFFCGKKLLPTKGDVKKKLPTLRYSNIAGWKIHHLSRCISYSRLGIFQQSLCLWIVEGITLYIRSWKQKSNDDMGVSKNRDTPKWMVSNGKPYENGWFDDVFQVHSVIAVLLTTPFWSLRLLPASWAWSIAPCVTSAAWGCGFGRSIFCKQT